MHHLGKAEIHASLSRHVIFHFIQGTRTLVLPLKNVPYVKLLQASDSGAFDCCFNFLAAASAFIAAICLSLIAIFYLIWVWNYF